MGAVHEKAPNGPRTGKRARLSAWLPLGAAALLSLYLLAYTPIHDWFHSLRMAACIARYDQAVAALSQEEKSEIWASALDYNCRLRPGTHFRLSPEEMQAYRAQLDFTGTGMLGYLQIPKIDVALPIYQTAGEDVLAQAVGHIPGSSLPVGGEGCHTALCAHRDLSTARLFHDLDKLAVGDAFTLTVLDECLTYEVDQITVVFPRQVDDLAIEPGEDFCTLISCHPHGSTAYRLLVRGKRAE